MGYGQSGRGRGSPQETNIFQGPSGEISDGTWRIVESWRVCVGWGDIFNCQGEAGSVAPIVESCSIVVGYVPHGAC